jgi:hypothetical protein
MTRRQPLPPLVRALGSMLPGSNISIIGRQPWHSLTFAGTQLCISIQVSGDDYESVAKRFSETLPEHEFHLPNILVADIAVTAQVAIEDKVILTIDAVLLDN